MKRFAITTALATVLSTAAVLPAQAQVSLAPKRIKDTGAVTLGRCEASLPFS